MSALSHFTLVLVAIFILLLVLGERGVPDDVRDAETDFNPLLVIIVS